MKKNILMISVYYPPIESIASNRIYSFAKYLDKSKYNVYVHTVETKTAYTNDLDSVFVSRSQNSPLFKPLLFEKRTNKLMHYAKVIYNKFVNIISKDSYQDWIQRSTKELSDLIETDNITLIISSFAPASSHILALRLKKRYPHLKWIADMRDEMSASPFIDEKTRRSYESLEQTVFEEADAITSVSKPILDEFRTMAAPTKLLFREVRNGYDFELLAQHNKNENFTISYVGNFYGSRNPDNFLEALSSLVAKMKIKSFRIKFIGVKTHFKIPKNLQNHIEVIAGVPHDEAIDLMRKSDALLLIHPNNGRKGVFTGKLFEYLATLRPIIALVDPDDVAAKLIKECNMGYVADFDDISAIKNVIMQGYEEYRDNRKKDVNLELIHAHHRKEQAKRLESLIGELLDG